jgi:hypothetical protein
MISDEDARRASASAVWQVTLEEEEWDVGSVAPFQKNRSTGFPLAFAGGSQI